MLFRHKETTPQHIFLCHNKFLKQWLLPPLSHLSQHRDIFLHTVDMRKQLPLLLGTRYSPILLTKTYMRSIRLLTLLHSACQERKDPCLLRIFVSDFTKNNKRILPRTANLHRSSHGISEDSEDRDLPPLRDKHRDLVQGYQIRLYSMAPIVTSHLMTGR